MAWKPTFDKGVACFNSGQLDEALVHMNQAAEHKKSDTFVIYESRAVVHEKLGNIKAALLDWDRVIDLAPDRWQGYSRSARLFDLLREHGSAVKMADYALTRLRPEDVQRRAQLAKLREKAVAAHAETQRLSQVIQTSYLLGKLPVETLVGIFSLLIDEDHTWAVKLSHICGHWRRVLINTPSAWQTLVLSEKHPVEKVKSWAQRAENRIARISVSISQPDRAAVLSQLRDLSWSDVSSLYISSEAFAELHCMLSDISLPHAFSNLHELTLLDFESPEQLSCCLSGPDWKLEILRLGGVRVLNLKKEWWQRIRRLKELNLTGFVGPFSMRVFANNPSLERLVLKGPTLFHPDMDDDAPPTSMENLRSIEFNDVFHPLHVLHGVIAPSITHFSLMTSGYMVDETLLHIARRASLVELCVSNCRIGLHTLPALLSSTPNLETLRINTMDGIVNEVLRFLSRKVVDSLPCRALQHVDVSECLDLTTSSLHAFVKTRTRHASESVSFAKRCAVISSLKVDGCPNIKRRMLPWFRSKVDEFSCVYPAEDVFIRWREYT